MTEQAWEDKLGISTGGRDAARADAYRYPYEPTPYCVLERLADAGYLTGENVLMDFGCGKGRVGIFLNHILGCRTIGVEYDREIWKQAVENGSAYNGVEFQCCRAETSTIADADCFYFFNPFSLELLRSVYGRILESWYEAPRSMRLFFYYPSDAYRSWLMTEPTLSFLTEIDCRDLFPGNDSRENVLIFEICS